MKYHFEFCIPNGASSVELDMPTAPMYISGDTYSGMCKMWLKRAILPRTTSSELAAGIGGDTPMIEFNTQAKNRFYLTTGSLVNLENCGSNAIYEIPIDNNTLVMDKTRVVNEYSGAMFQMNQAGTSFAAYPFYTSVDTNGGGALAVRDAIPLIARAGVKNAGDTDGGGGMSAGADQETSIRTLAPRGSAGQNNNGGIAVDPIFPQALHANSGGHTAVTRYRFGVSNTDSAGNLVGLGICYHNSVMDDRDCLIVGAPWGGRITAKLKVSSLQNLNNNDNFAVAVSGTARFEIVIEPMVNDDPVEVTV